MSLILGRTTKPVLMCVVDADMVRDADRFKMDLVGGLERTLHGQVKPSSFILLPDEALPLISLQ